MLAETLVLIDSQNVLIFKKYVEQLLESKSISVFCSKERLEKVREIQKQNKENPKYDGHCIGLSEKEIASNLDKDLPYVVN